MKNIILGALAYLFGGAAYSAIVTVDHDVTLLPASGYLEIDLDGDGVKDINLASNYYVSVWTGGTQFTNHYSHVGDEVGPGDTWRQGNDWLDLHGVGNYVDNGFLYLGIRNTSAGNNYGYIKYNYYADSNSISLNSYTFDDSGSAITVAGNSVPEPSTLLLLTTALVCVAAAARSKRR
ncbi:hypothetical protein CDL60_03255 [Roseateles noduli]|nr:hypothetical protein CDL60_03255 [Roseateles noduli]